MKRAKNYLIAILAIGSFLGIGWVLLALFGTSSVYFFAVMLIVSAILLSILYVWKTSKAKKNIGWLRISKEKVLSEIKENYLETEKQLNTIENLVDVNKEVKEFTAVRRDIALLGCYSSQFEIIGSMLNRYNLSFLTQKKSEIDSKINKIRDSAFPKCKYKLDEIAKNISLEMKDLKDTGFNTPELNLDTEVRNLSEAAKKFEYFNEKILNIIKLCDSECTNLLDIIKSKLELGKIDNAKISDIENELAQARKKSGLESLSLYARAREKLNTILKNEIDNIKNIIKNKDMTRILESKVLSEENEKELRDLINKFEKIDNNSIGNFDALLNEYKTCIKNTVYSAYNTLIKMEENLSSRDLPEWLWKKNIRVYDFNAVVNDKQDLALFNEEALMKINKILDRYDLDDLVMGIIDNYDVVEKIIEKTLNDKGKVYEKDLKVGHAVEFLNLYKLKNPDKAKNIIVSAPVQRKKEEEFELDIEVKNEEHKEKKEKTIEIKRKRGRPKKSPEKVSEKISENNPDLLIETKERKEKKAETKPETEQKEEQKEKKKADEQKEKQKTKRKTHLLIK